MNIPHTYGRNRMNDFLKSVIKEIGDDYASIAADGVEAGDVDSFIEALKDTKNFFR